MSVLPRRDYGIAGRDGCVVLAPAWLERLRPQKGYSLMSTYWGYLCRDDGDASPCWLNRGQDVLRGIAAAWPHIKALREADTAGYIDVSVMGGRGWAEPSPIEWLQAHDGHTIVLESEYGDEAPLAEDVAVPATPPRIEAPIVGRMMRPPLEIHDD